MVVSSSLITGAASGIGRAIALRLAAPGQILHLGDRDTEKLGQVATACQAKGATVNAQPIDVTEAAAMADWLGAAGRLDLVVASAGVQFTTVSGPPEDAAQTRRLFAVNLTGVLNTVLPGLDLMAVQPLDATGWRGRIAVMSSLAAFVAVPGAPAYCASKAAVDAWAVGNAWAARRRGIRITSVCPGYVRTPMTAINDFPMSGLLEPDEAARRILRGIAAGKVRVAFPWRMALAARLGAALPAGSAAWLLARRQGVGMARKVAVVTGVTGGIGRWIARGIATAGYHVVLVARSAERGQAAQDWLHAEVPGAATELRLADLSRLAETRAVAAAIAASHPQIALLVNNAGVFLDRRQVTPEGHEMVLAVNHLSPFLLATALAPALQAGAPARLVTIGSSSSDGAAIDPDDLELTRGWNLVRAYRRAKLAQMMTTFALAERWQGSGVTANVVHPGGVATGLVRAPGVVGLAWRVMAPFLLTAAQGADTPVYVATAPELAGISGEYFKFRRIVPANRLARDAALVERVWAATEGLLQGW